MKIGICVRTWGEIGGIGVYTRNLVHNLVNLDRNNEYVLFYQNRDHMGVFRDRNSVREVYVPTFGKLNGARTWIWDQATMPYSARCEDVDVILHTKMAIPLTSRRKTVMVLHGSQRFVHPELHTKSDIWFTKTVYPYYLQRAALLFAVSERVRQDVIHHVGLDPQKVKTVHLAASPVFRVVRDEECVEKVQQKYKLPRRYALYVGHIDPGKNVGSLFQAFARVRKQEDVHLVVAGAYRRSYQSDLDLIPRLGLEENVHLIGRAPQEDLAVLYSRAELLVFPSLYESFGLPNVEAQACGCPVVVSRTGGFPEVAGEGALYVDPRDETELANAILRVLTDSELRKKLVEKGFENVKRFSWEKTARQTLDGLESLLPS